MKRPPDKGVYFKDIHQWAREAYPDDGEPQTERLRAELEEKFFFAASNPWKADQFPDLVKLLEHNSESLQKIREASQRSHYFMPMIDTWDSCLVVNADAEFIDVQYDLLWMLSLSVMKHLRDGDAPSALDEVLTIRRLGRLLGQNANSLARAHVACLLMTSATQLEYRIAQSGQVMRSQMLDYRNTINDLPPVKCDYAAILNTQRFGMIDAMIKVARKKVQLSDALQMKVDDVIDPSIVNWTLAIKQVHPVTDQAIDAFNSEGSYSERRERLDAAIYPVRSFFPEKSMLFPGTRGSHGRFVGRFFTSIMWNVNPWLLGDEVQAIANHRLSMIVLALEIYKLDRGSYPKSLETLSSEYFEEIPVDPFVDEPFRYRKSDDDYLLYSVGRNMEDNDGMGFLKHAEPDKQGDDIRASNPSEDWNSKLEEFRQEWERDHPETKVVPAD